MAFLVQISQKWNERPGAFYGAANSATERQGVDLHAQFPGIQSWKNILSAAANVCSGYPRWAAGFQLGNRERKIMAKVKENWTGLGKDSNDVERVESRGQIDVESHK